MRKRRLIIIVLMSLFVSVSLSTLTAKANSQPQPAAYWPLDEGSGSVAGDISGNGNDGTIYGASWVDGAVGEALQFDGSNDYVGVPNSSSLQISGAITVEAWVYRHSQSRDEMIVSKRSGETGFILYFYWGHNKAVFCTGSTSLSGVESTIDIEANTWYHIAGTYDGEVRRIYINGVLNNSQAAAGQLASNTVGLTIGKYNLGSSHYFDGVIDEVRIYSRALSQSEIEEHSNNPPNTPSMPDGPEVGSCFETYTYSTSTTDPDGDQVQYYFDWGDETGTWTGFVDSGTSASASHSWSSGGLYEIRVKARDIHSAESSWSFSHKVLITNDDDNEEVGVEWVIEYPDPIPDLLWAAKIAEYFYYGYGIDEGLYHYGWTLLFDHGYGTDSNGYPNYSASERHFEKPEVNGWDSSYIDAVDFAFFCGHGGGPGQFFAFANNQDGDGVYENKVYWHEAEWGDGDLEWIVIHSCSILWDDDFGVFDRWGWPVFRGLHALMSFRTPAYSYTNSPGFVAYMTDDKGPYPITEAWKRETIDHQPSDVRGAYLADWYCEEDYLPGYGEVHPDERPDILSYVHWQC